MKVLIIKEHRYKFVEEFIDVKETWIISDFTDVKELIKEYKIWKEETKGKFYEFMQNKNFQLLPFDELTI